MRYAAYDDCRDTPHVVADGSAQPGTVLTLSHWPGSGTPRELLADLSAEIAFRYLDTPAAHVDADLVTNNHFDQDGLMSLYALVDPAGAQARRERVIDVARAGDFSCFHDRDSARIAMAIAAYADPARSPIGDDLQGLDHPVATARCYAELLDRVADMLDHVEQSRTLWVEEDAYLEESQRAITTGAVRIEERPDLDLAVVTVPEDIGDATATRFSGSVAAPLHPYAVANATDRFRVLTMRGRRYGLELRYETWVQYVSRPVLGRPDLQPLADALTADEPSGARWTFDGVGDLTPCLRLTGTPTGESALAPETFRRRVEEFLASAPAAWDPFAAR